MKYTYNDLLEEIQKIPPHRRGSLIDASLGEDGDTYYVISLEEMREEQGLEHQADVEKLTPKTNEFEIDDILGDDDGFTLGPAPKVDADDTEFLLGPEEEKDTIVIPDDDDDEALLLPPELVDELEMDLVLDMGDEPEEKTFPELRIKK